MATIMYDTPGNCNKTLRPLSFKILGVFPILMKRSIGIIKSENH